tara:strand:+ start:5445 stop:5789 length:345 start_codon:yes stop_codon:yes gene_type:complete
MNEFKEPKIEKDFEKGILSISGISMMEDAMSFYNPLKLWVSEFLSVSNSMIFDFNLEYFNSSSAKQLIQLISLIEEDHFSGKVIWRYPNHESILHDRGKELEAILDVEFEFISF